MTSVYKKENSAKVKNYRPVSILSMQKQISECNNQFLRSFLYGYRKGFCTALLWLIEKWKHQLHKKGFAGATLMDLPKAFDIINYDLLIG